MKITKYFLSLAAAVGMVAGCYKPELVEIAAPENVVAPVLESVEDIVITKENLNTGVVALKWSAADFGAQTQVNYSVEVAAAGSDAKNVLTSGISGTESEVNYQTLNTFLLSNLGFVPNVASDVNFYISAKVGEYSKVYSEPVKVVVTPMEAVVPESDLYGKVWVIGDYCGWDFGKTQFLFDYAKDETIYSGVVDFGEKAANGWKISGAAGWDDACNWGLDGDAAAPEAEASQIQLISSGGSKDIKIYSKRFYNLEFDKSALTLKVKNSFDQLGVIGDFNSWGGDVVMEYNPKLVRFYADVEIPADGGLKVRVDADWTTSWGKDMGGDNLPVSAGNYRVYLDLNKGTLTLDAKMYGQPEPGVSDVEPEPEPVKWYIKGNFNEWGGEPVVEMTNSGDKWTAKKVKLAAIDEFKVASSENTWLGGPEENADSQIDAADPYKVFKPTLGEAFATGEKNIAPGAEGEYDIVYDAAAGTITVSAAKLIEGWALVGTITGWADGADIVMTQNGAVWSVTNVAITKDDQFKIRKDGSWDVNRGAAGDVEPAVVTVGEGFAAVAGGKNLAVPADGNYDIYYNEAEETIHVLATGSDAPVYGTTWYLVGTFNNWATGDVNFMMKKDGEYLVFKGLTLAENGEVKFNAGDWDVNRGGTFAVDAALAATQDGPNFKVPAGTYDVYLSLDEATAYFMTPGKTPADAGAAPEPEPQPEPTDWFMVGDINGWTVADENYKMTKEGDYFVFKNLVLDANKGIKFNAGSWDVQRGLGEGTFAPNAAVALSADGGSGNITVTAGTYDVYLDVEGMKAYFMTDGKTPADAGAAPEPEPEPEVKAWHMAGSFNGWAAQDANYKMTKEGDFYVFKNFVLAANTVMKFVVGSWAEELGGDGSAFGANAALNLAKENMKVNAGTYDVYLDEANKKAYFMTDGKTPAEAGEVVVEPYDLTKILCGLTGSFNGWSNPPTGGYLASYVSHEGNVATYKVSNVALAAGDELKLILDDAWCGGTLNPDFSIDIVYSGGANVAVPEGISGNFDVTITFKYELIDKVHTFSEIKAQVTPAA